MRWPLLLAAAGLLAGCAQVDEQGSTEGGCADEGDEYTGGGARGEFCPNETGGYVPQKEQDAPDATNATGPSG